MIIKDNSKNDISNNQIILYNEKNPYINTLDLSNIKININPINNYLDNENDEAKEEDNNNILNETYLEGKITNILTIMRKNREQNKYTPFIKILDGNEYNNGNENTNKKMIENNSKDKNTLNNMFKKYGEEYDKVYYNPKLDKDYSNLYTFLSNDANKEPIKSPKKVIINAYIESIDDLLKIIKDNPLDRMIEYNINMKALHNIKKPLIDLNNMIGIKELKVSIVDQLLFYIQEFNSKSAKQQDYMHTVIYGPPGTGKTEIAKIIGNIFSKLGVLKKNVFKKVTRSDLIAGYLGQTAIKTKDVINECLDGVLFIDEAYALGNEEKRDSFAKECIDTLCEALSDHHDKLMVIVAGYKKELQECFFKYNQGLDSRFTWRYNTDQYNAEELKMIFEKKVKDYGWKMNDTVKISWFENNKEHFKFFGRDMEVLFSKTKIAHSRRVFCKPKEEKTIITLDDMKNGFKLYLKNLNDPEENESSKYIMNTMYN